MYWMVAMSFFSSVGFGLGAYHLTQNAVAGIDIFIGVFCLCIAVYSALSCLAERYLD